MTGVISRIRSHNSPTYLHVQSRDTAVRKEAVSSTQLSLQIGESYSSFCASRLPCGKVLLCKDLCYPAAHDLGVLEQQTFGVFRPAKLNRAKLDLRCSITPQTQSSFHAATDRDFRRAGIGRLCSPGLLFPRWSGIEVGIMPSWSEFHD